MASLLMTFGFILVVVLVEVIKNAVSTNSVLTPEYTSGNMLRGFSAELLRAILTTWLFERHEIRNRSVLVGAILFGIVCTTMIGAMWILLGVGMLEKSAQLNFVLQDGIILILQGILSGIILWFIYRSEKKPVRK